MIKLNYMLSDIYSIFLRLCKLLGIVGVLFFVIFNNTTRLYAEEGKFVILPLPFYSERTGYGLSIKLLHTNLGQGVGFDSTSFITTENQSGTFNKIGQNKIPGSPHLYWHLKGGGLNSEQKFYGLGNHTDKHDKATYRRQSYFVNAKFGFRPAWPILVYVSHTHSQIKYKDFDDPNGLYTDLFRGLVPKKANINTFGAGFSFKLIDDKIRPRWGLSFSYDYTIASELYFLSDYQFRKNQAKASILFPLWSNITHGTNVQINTISHKAPVLDYPAIKVRGIGSTTHRDRISYVLRNEERIQVSDNWMLVAFYDRGKVKNELKTSYAHNLHYGYGFGFRYIIKDALICRLDIGFSDGGESSVIFNYGHTF